LLLTTLHRLLTAGYTDIRIEVEERNTAAYHLYRACGFVPYRRYGQYGRQS
jgi:ribosomal protein S18 acetylase RimI-like enzyme